MSRKKKILVPEARQQLDRFKKQVMKAKGFEAEDANSVKYEVANELGIRLSQNDNGELTSAQAGKIGGPIGGNMVKEMVRLAQEQMARK